MWTACAKLSIPGSRRLNVDCWLNVPQQQTDKVRLGKQVLSDKVRQHRG